MQRSTVAALSAATVLVAGGYYGVADALDIVPGLLTLAPPSAELQEFPTTSPVSLPSTPAQGLSSEAPLPDAAAVQALIDSLPSQPGLEGASVGVQITDVATGSTLGQSLASTPLTPASSLKTLVAWATLSHFDADHRLATTATLSGSTVTLVGGGDMLLAADAGDPSSIVGRAGLGDLARAAAEQLQAQGVTAVSVAVDDTLFTGPAFSPAWDSSYSQWVSPISPLQINVRQWDGAGVPYPSDPAIEAAQAFVAALQAAGIRVDGEPTRAASPAGASEIARVESATLPEILSVSLKESDNTMTEVEARLLSISRGGAGSFEGAAAAVTETLREEGFDVTGLSMVDASGLAESNKVPAALLAEVLTRAAGANGGSVGRTLVASLPIAGLDGTLHARFTDSDAAGLVRAKTGTLEHATSLSGVMVTRSGRLLAYSVLIDGFADGGLLSARQAIDEALIAPVVAM